MKTSNDFVREIRVLYGKKGILSDYALAKLLWLTRQTVSAHKSGSAKAFGDETGQRIAELLDLDPAYVLACLAAERAKRPDVRATWQRVAEQFEQIKHAARVAMLLILLGAVNLATPPDAQAAQGANGLSLAHVIHYAKLWLSGLLRAFCRGWAAWWPRLTPEGLRLSGVG